MKIKKINFKKELNKKYKKNKIDPCPICKQHMDLVVTSHKNKPYVDNVCYNKICFVCFCAPKTSEQKYDNKEYIKEVIDLEYNIKNLKSAKELFADQSADSLSEAKRSIESIKNLKVKKEIKNKIKPKLECYLNEN